MKIVQAFTPETNFWIEHSQLAAAGPFKKIYDRDRSKQKTKSSKLMWSIALIWDYSSFYYNLPEFGEDGKVETVFEDVYGDKAFYENNRDIVDPLKHYYLRLQDSVAMRSLRSVEKKLNERELFLDKTKYDLGLCNEKGQWVGNTAVILDKMMSDTKKLNDLYGESLKVVLAELAAQDDVVKGGGTLSLSDQNKI